MEQHFPFSFNQLFIFLHTDAEIEFFTLIQHDKKIECENVSEEQNFLDLIILYSEDFYNKDWQKEMARDEA